MNHIEETIYSGKQTEEQNPFNVLAESTPITAPQVIPRETRCLRSTAQLPCLFPFHQVFLFWQKQVHECTSNRRNWFDCGQPVGEPRKRLINVHVYIYIWLLIPLNRPTTAEIFVPLKCIYVYMYGSHGDSDRCLFMFNLLFSSRSYLFGNGAEIRITKCTSEVSNRRNWRNANIYIWLYDYIYIWYIYVIEGPRFFSLYIYMFCIRKPCMALLPWKQFTAFGCPPFSYLSPPFSPARGVQFK